MQDDRTNTPRIITALLPTAGTHTSPPFPLPIPHSTLLLDQLPQWPNFALNRIVLGDDALKRTDLLDMRCERGSGVLQLGLGV
jgi:hypothetical protein